MFPLMMNSDCWFVDCSCKYDQTALFVNYREDERPVDCDLTSRHGPGGGVQYLVSGGESERERSHLPMMTAVAAAPSLPSSSTLRKVLVRTSLTCTLESVSPEKSPAKSRPRSLSAGVRFFSYFTSNLGRLSLVEDSLISRDFPLMTCGWKTSVFQLEQRLRLFIFYLRNLTWPRWFPRQGGRRGAPCRRTPPGTGCRCRNPAGPQCPGRPVWPGLQRPLLTSCPPLSPPRSAS